MGHVLNVSRPGHITFNLDLATATNGSSVLVWAEPVLDRDEQIHARTITSAGTLGPPRTLSQPDVIEPPRVAIDADGNAIAVWTRALPTYGTQARTLSPSGDLGPVFTISDTATTSAHFPDVVTAADGDSVVAWVAPTAEPVAQARTISSTGSRGPILTLGPWNWDGEGRQHGPELAGSADGHAIAALVALDGSVQRATTRTISPTGALGPLRSVSPGSGDVFRPEVVSAGDGSWLAAWGFHRPGSSRAGLQARAIPAAGRLEPVEQVAPLGVFGGQDYPFSGDGGLAASADEHAIAVWDRHLDSSQSVIEASLGP